MTFKEIIQKILNSIYPKKSAVKLGEEYLDDVFVLEGREGCAFKDLKVRHCTAGAVTGDIGLNNKYPIIFYVKVIGFADGRAPVRDWGMNIKKFAKYYLKKM